MPRGQIPAGTVTFLFTDIEGSTKLWEAYPETMRTSLARHDALMREAIGASNGYVFKTVGDAFCAAFDTAARAVECVLNAQLALTAEPWPAETPIKVRMALHTGTAEVRDGDYFGSALNRVSRLLSTAHGWQVVVSAATQELVRDALPSGSMLRNLGEHRLKDLGRPETVFQLLHECLSGDFPPLRSLDNPDLRHNLPQQVTSFVGRERELSEIRSLLDKTRLLTLTGSGGSGKTRLALQSAADLLDGSGDGVWLVELAPLSDSSLVAQAVANALGVMEEPGQPMESILARHLKPKRLLLVLDNCEHLLGACASLADSIHRGCPQVSILATSREGLGVAGETTYRVPSLTLPDPVRGPTPEYLGQFESVRLFVDRAVQVQTSFTVTNENAPAVASICHRLDGIPLAIELAASRVRSMSVEKINERLMDAFRILTGGDRTALPRHQTIRGLIQWSYGMLSDDDKILLNRLSVFAGSWTLEAAEEVCSGGAVDSIDVLDLLTSLEDKSLINFNPVEGEDRYVMLQTVQEFAEQELGSSGEKETVHARHADYYVSMAAAAFDHLLQPDQTDWTDRLERERDNLLRAHAWCCQRPEAADRSIRLVVGVCQHWLRRGHAHLVRKVVEEAEPQLDRCTAPDIELMGRYAHAQTLYFFGDFAQASEAVDRYIPSALRANQPARALTGYSLAIFARMGVGDLAGASKCAEAAERLAESISERAALSMYYCSAGELDRVQGDLDSAERWYRRCLEIEDDEAREASILANLCYVSIDKDDTTGAIELLLKFSEIVTSKKLEAVGHMGLVACSAIFTKVSEYSKAARMAGVIDALSHKMGVSPEPPDREFLERHQQKCKAELGEEAYQLAFLSGVHDAGTSSLEHLALFLDDINGVPVL